MNTPPATIGDWQLERYRLDELPAAEREAVRQALALDTDLRERLARLDRSDRDILEQHPPARLTPAIRSRAAEAAARTGGSRRAVRPWGLALAASCGLVLAAAGILFIPGRGPQEGGGVTRVKGLAPRLYVYRKASTEGVEPLSPGARARENDVVQLAYQAAGRRFGAIVSIDARGVLTRHLPATGSQATPLKPGPPFALPEAYRLDDAPGFERFYLVTSDGPFAMEPVIAAVARAAGGHETPEGRLDLPPSLDQYVFVLRKESSR